MRLFTRFIALAAAAALQACATTPLHAPALATAEARAPVTILISIDGLRADYLDRGVTPTIAAMAQGGLRAAMRPSFPSKTFPNHWAIVTGLRPDRSGIVANKMEDAARPGETFTMASDDPFWWNGATPVWVDAEAAGVRTATMFWPGSNVAVGGTRARSWPNAITGGARPSDWMQYNEALTPEQRVRALIDWLRRPAAIRPRFLTLYFEAVDTAGHDFGPDSVEVNRALADTDRAMAMLRAELTALGQPANIVIAADHGMAATSSARVIALDTLLPADSYRIVETGPYASLWAAPGRTTALEAVLLKRHPHMQCWRKAEIPARFRYGGHPRVPPYLCLAETGWEVLATAPKPGPATVKGNHGFDPADPAMAALFVASGPAFQAGQTLPDFDNVDVYALLRHLLGLPPATGTDGSDAVFRTGLR